MEIIFLFGDFDPFLVEKGQIWDCSLSEAKGHQSGVTVHSCRHQSSINCREGQTLPAWCWCAVVQGAARDLCVLITEQERMVSVLNSIDIKHCSLRQSSRQSWLNFSQVVNNITCSVLVHVKPSAVIGRKESLRIKNNCAWISTLKKSVKSN